VARSGGGTVRALVVRRARVQATVVLAAFFLVLGATTALVTVAAFAADTTARAVAATAQHATAAQRRVIVQTSGVSSGRVLDSGGRSDVRTTLTALPGTTVTGLTGAAHAVAGSDQLHMLWASPEARSSAVLVSGEWPGPADTTAADATPANTAEELFPEQKPIPVAVPADEATRYHLAVGSSVELAPGIGYSADGGNDLLGHVVGVYRPKSPNDGVWAIPATAGSGTVAFLADTSVFDNAQVQSGGGVVVISLDLSKLTAGNLDAAARQLHKVAAVLANDSSLGTQGTASTDAAALLDGTVRALDAARPAIAIPAVEAVAIACCAIAATARLLARDRRAQAALMRSRGASVRHLAAYDALEALTVTVPALVIAPFLAVRLAALLPPSDSLKPALGGPVWLADAAAALVFTIVLVLSGSVTARDDSVARAGRLPIGAAAAGVDLAALALAAAGIWELHSALSRQAASGALDPLTVCAPTLAVLAFALSSVRLVAVVGRLAQAAAGRARGWSGAFGSWHAARMMRTHTAAVVLIAAATALVVIDGAERIAADRSARDQADFSVGADVRATDAAVEPLRTGGAPADLPGVAGVAAVQRLSGNIGRSGTGGSAALLSADPAQWQQTAILRSDLAPDGASGAAAPLRAQSMPEPGFTLPGRPHALRLTVRLSESPAAGSTAPGDTAPRLAGSAVVGANVNVTLAGAAGEPLTLSAPLSAATGPQQVRIDLSAYTGEGSQVAWPLRVIRVGVVVPTPSAGTSTVGFDVLALGADTGAVATPSTQSWTARTSVGIPGVDNTQYDLTLLRQAGRATGIRSGSALLHGTFDPGTVPPSVGHPGQSSYSAGLSAAPPAAVPAVATPQFLAAAGAHVGSTVDVSVDGGDLLLKIVGQVPGLPATLPADNAVLIDQGSLDAFGYAHSLVTVGSSELWISTRPGQAAQVASRVVSSGLARAAQDRFTLSAALVDDPVRSGPLGALTIAALAAVLFALCGYGAHVAALLRERVPQLAAVRALGVGSGRIGLAFGVEQSLVAAVGVAAGGAVGLLLSELIVPAIVLARDGRPPIPAVLVDPDWTAVGWSAIAAALVIAAAGSWAALLAPRLHTATLLRAGDAG